MTDNRPMSTYEDRVTRATDMTTHNISATVGNTRFTGLDAEQAALVERYILGFWGTSKESDEAPNR